MLKLGDFIKLLDADLSWRKKEATNLLLLWSEENEHIIVKALLLLIYSHWEGFVKNSCKLYLRYVSDQSINIDDLTSNFAAISLKGRIKELNSSSESLTMVNELAFISMVTGDVNKIFKVNNGFKRNEKDKSIINTNDSLNFKIYSSLLDVVGIGQRDCVATKEVYLDEKLLNNRNKISHGSKLDSVENEFDLDIESIKEIKDMIFSIMTSLSDDLKYYAEYEYYFNKNNKLSGRYNDISNNKLDSALRTIFD